MNGREKVTYHLTRMPAEQADVPYDPYHRPSSEDLEDARYFSALSKKNASGTLTTKEAEEVSELFEGDSPVIIDTNLGRWVEIDSKSPERVVSPSMMNDKACETWGHMNPEQRAKALGGVTTGYGRDSSWEALTNKDRAIVTDHLKRHYPESIGEV